MYVASAVYADRAGTADTASNALKLGGYDASDYLRKDEVQTVTAAYQEIEWTTPGTYNWIVPEGVNSILVTTVGGGGGYGYSKVDNPYNGKRLLAFPGGSGGEVIVNQLVKTTPGETITVIVGNAGVNVTNSTGGGEFNETEITQYNGRNGGNGGISYIARNGTMISATKARGGAGGLAAFNYSNYSCLYDSNGQINYNRCYNWYDQRTKSIESTTATTKYKGGGLYYGINTSKKIFMGLGTDGWQGIQGYSGSGGQASSTEVTSTYWNNNGTHQRARGIYYNCSGAGSWGGGGSHTMKYGSRAGTGGGGMHYSMHGQIYPGYGMVRILAIGVSYDE